MSRNASIGFVFSLLLTADLSAQAERMDAQMLARIREEGTQRSQAMEHLIWISDIYGPRLTGSPTMDQAAKWTMDKLTSWGVSHVRQERFAFGKGWALERFHATMTAPQVMPIYAHPKSWTAGTNGLVNADVVFPNIRTNADLAKWRGKLRGAVVLTQPAREVRMLDGRIVLRMNENDIKEVLTDPRATAAAGGGRAGAAGGAAGAAGGGRGNASQAAEPTGSDARPTAQQLAQFWIDEGVTALVDRGGDSDMAAGGSDLTWQTQRVDGGTFGVGGGGSRGADAGRGPASITMAVEHYNRMIRILERGVPVKMEIDVRTRFFDETEPRAFNILAEIPGTDPRLKDEVVIIGAHFDSHHGATGATDNATGSAAMLEAMRILKAVGAQPRRTIRIALWGAEEQGLMGSAYHARTHYTDTIAQKKFAAYYNIDNGTGKIRGIWMQQNPGVKPIFEQWIAPLKDLGVELLGPRSVGSTDHSSFDRLGLPAFQFIQERYEYNSRTHHTNMDFTDRVQKADVEQMAVVVATFAYLTAQRDAVLPRR